MMPGFGAYHDPAFPEDRLRMVACNSVLRERWGQMLNEAKRIANKYHLTVDPNVTDSRIVAIERNHVTMFVPEPIAAAAYRSHLEKGRVRTVAALIEALRTA